MSLFKKKKEENKPCCCSQSCNCESQKSTGNSNSSVKVLGSGCPKCNELENATKQALSELGMDTAIDHVKDFAEIASYGVMSTPALVVDGKVVSYGKVLKKEEVVELLKKVRQ